MTSSCPSADDLLQFAPPRYRVHHLVFTETDLETYDEVTPEALQGGWLYPSVKIRSWYFLLAIGVGIYATFLFWYINSTTATWVLGLIVSATTAILIAVPPGDILRYIRLRWEILKYAK